jgi:hypothetical protein
LKALDERSSEFGLGYPPGFPAGYQGTKEASDAKIGRLILHIKTSQSAVRVLTKISRDFDVIQSASGPLPDCFLSTLQVFFTGPLAV